MKIVLFQSVICFCQLHSLLAFTLSPMKGWVYTNVYNNMDCTGTVVNVKINPTNICLPVFSSDRNILHYVMYGCGKELSATNIFSDSQCTKPIQSSATKHRCYALDVGYSSMTKCGTANSHLSFVSHHDNYAINSTFTNDGCRDMSVSMVEASILDTCINLKQNGYASYKITSSHQIFYTEPNCNSNGHYYSSELPIEGQCNTAITSTKTYQGSSFLSQSWETVWSNPAPALQPVQAPSSPRRQLQLLPVLLPVFTGIDPSYPPTSSPTTGPSMTPSDAPSVAPSNLPTVFPSIAPSTAPTLFPSGVPTVVPSLAPSGVPSFAPFAVPSMSPSTTPSQFPSHNPSTAPVMAPSMSPSAAPTQSPSDIPSLIPSEIPSNAPSAAPTQSTDRPSVAPIVAPSTPPTDAPSEFPTEIPSTVPSVAPSELPSVAPTTMPSTAPSAAPSQLPTDIPSAVPVITPSETPSFAPVFTPSVSPSVAPSLSPTGIPSIAPVTLSTSPSVFPSTTSSNTPSFAPSVVPSDAPSVLSSYAPSAMISAVPSMKPSFGPSPRPVGPTFAPFVVFSSRPTSMKPSVMPTLSRFPSLSPVTVTSTSPSVLPSANIISSSSPSTVVMTSTVPSLQTTSTPSVGPTLTPTDALTGIWVTPTMYPVPTSMSSARPTRAPSDCTEYVLVNMTLSFSGITISSIQNDNVNQLIIVTAVRNFLVEDATLADQIDLSIMSVKHVEDSISDVEVLLQLKFIVNEQLFQNGDDGTDYMNGRLTIAVESGDFMAFVRVLAGPGSVFDTAIALDNIFDFPQIITNCVTSHPSIEPTGLPATMRLLYGVASLSVTTTFGNEEQNSFLETVVAVLSSSSAVVQDIQVLLTFTATEEQKTLVQQAATSVLLSNTVDDFSSEESSSFDHLRRRALLETENNSANYFTIVWSMNVNTDASTVYTVLENSINSRAFVQILQSLDMDVFAESSVVVISVTSEPVPPYGGVNTQSEASDNDSLASKYTIIISVVSAFAVSICMIMFYYRQKKRHLLDKYVNSAGASRNISKETFSSKSVVFDYNIFSSKSPPAPAMHKYIKNPEVPEPSRDLPFDYSVYCVNTPPHSTRNNALRNSVTANTANTTNTANNTETNLSNESLLRETSFDCFPLTLQHPNSSTNSSNRNSSNTNNSNNSSNRHFSRREVSWEIV